MCKVTFVSTPRSSESCCYWDTTGGYRDARLHRSSKQVNINLLSLSRRFLSRCFSYWKVVGLCIAGQVIPETPLCSTPSPQPTSGTSLVRSTKPSRVVRDWQRSGGGIHMEPFHQWCPVGPAWLTAAWCKSSACVEKQLLYIHQWNTQTFHVCSARPISEKSTNCLYITWFFIIIIGNETIGISL